jgi:hypothetical protein
VSGMVRSIKFQLHTTSFSIVNCTMVGLDALCLDACFYRGKVNRNEVYPQKLVMD